MAINDPYSSQTAARQPRLQVIGTPPNAPAAPLQGALSAEVTLNNYYHCAQFSVTFAANMGPPGWWDQNPPFLVDIQFSVDGGASWQSQIIGEVDKISTPFETGTLTMSGRDLSARFIEAKTQEAFLNQTSSQVATTLAGKHNMQAQVTPTSTLVGRFYSQDHSRITLDQFSRATTEWDLLTYLAQNEGFDVFVQGQTLYFQPETLPNADPYAIVWTPPSPSVPRLNVMSLHAERSLVLAKDIQVTVRSWNSRQQKSFTKIARGSGVKAASAASANSPQNIVIVRPNLTEDQALQLAQKTLAELTKFERVVDVEMPGELTLTPRNMVSVSGTGTSFDQSYFIESVRRELSFDSGFRQSMRLKNTSPRSETIVQ